MKAHSRSIAPWERDHCYLGCNHDRNAGRTRVVMVLTGITMVAEIVAGSMYGSVALLADGLHMAGHVAVLGAAAYAYSYARHHSNAAAYSFGTGKVGDLVGFASALVLGVVAIAMVYESGHRLIAPETIAFGEALIVAVVGFTINLVCAALLWDRDHSHHHEHGHGHGHDHHHHHADHNLQAAYLHLLTDLLTSVLAIAALLAVAYLGWIWMDPIMGMVGAVIIVHWAWKLLRRTANVLLDTTPGTAEAVRQAIERDADNRVADLHVWRVGPGHLAVMLTVVTCEPRPPGYYKLLLSSIAGLSHVTIEVETWPSIGDGAFQDVGGYSDTLQLAGQATAAQ